MRKKVLLWMATLVVTCGCVFAGAAFAIDVGTLSSGSTIYIDGSFVGFNKEARVVRVDRSSNKAYVYVEEDDEYKWVHGSNLIGWLDRTQRNLDQLNTIYEVIKWFGSSEKEER